MTREEIIAGLQFTVDMFLLNPKTGETREDYEINDMDKTTIDACKGAIELLEQEPCEDAVSITSVFEIMGNLLSIPYDFDRNITEKDVSESMDKIREVIEDGKA